MEGVRACLLAALAAISCTVSPEGTASTPKAISSPTQVATPAEVLPPMEVERAFPRLSFTGMTAMAFPDDGSDRLFVALKEGRIVAFANDQDVDEATTFLDISRRVNDRGMEEGLLGLAVDPAFEENGHLFVYYSASSPRRIVVSRFRAAPGPMGVADPESERVVLEVRQPYSNHNGGQVAFGPDGYLYIGLGDGGSRGDPEGHGQNAATLLGTILRVDVSTIDTGGYAVPSDNPFVGVDDARDEIWAYGLRNPWRFSFDRQTGTLWAADVGQWNYEEVHVVQPGRNYGWNIMEGAHCYSLRVGCDRTGLELPVAEYEHDEGCSITGGYVYRGSRLPALTGAYVYGDYCSGKVWALKYDGAQVTDQRELAETDLSISSFGEGPSGELYILDFNPSRGRGIYRFAR